MQAKKRFLSILMATTLALTLTPAAFAAEETVDEIPMECIVTEDCQVEIHEDGCPATVVTEMVIPVEEEVIPNEKLAEEIAVWDGQTKEAIPASGEISTAAQLAWLAEQVNGGENFKNKTFVLINDIDLGNNDFTPIGTYSAGFAGIFDGGEKTIRNAVISGGDDANSTIWVGLFGCVNEGTIKNLTLDNIDVTNTSTASGGDNAQSASGTAAAMLRGGATVDHVTVLDTCSVSGVYRTGGIVGSSRDVDSTISYCINEAAVTGSGQYTGGIVGAAHNVWRQGTTGTKVEYCENHGGVNGTSEVGGIAGYTDRATIESCTNQGSVIGTGNYGTGGIVGCDIYNTLSILFKPSTGSTITNCVNTGAVTAPRAGGILGSYVVAPGKDQNTSDRFSTITGCTNLGAISSRSGSGRCGAIYGAPISYKSGDADEKINHMKVKIIGCTVGGTVEDAEVPSDDAAFATFISPSTHVVLEGNMRSEGIK